MSKRFIQPTDKLTEFNVTEFIDMVSDSTLKLTFNKLLYVIIGVILKKDNHIQRLLKYSFF